MATHTSNFDCSRTGVNIELYAYSDTCLSYHDFQNEFVHSAHNTGRRNELIYTGYLNGPCNDLSHYEREWITSGLTDRQIVDHLFHYLTESPVTRAKLRDYVETWHSYGWSSPIRGASSDGDIAERLYYVRELLGSLQYYDEFMASLAEPAFGEVHVTGHSQGDYATVLVPREVMDEFGWTPDTIYHQREYFHNLIFCAPTYINLLVNEQEYRPDDLDPYNYDRDATIASLLGMVDPEHREAVEAFLDVNLKEWIEDYQ